MTVTRSRTRARANPDAIPVPDPGLTPDAMIEAARSMREVLRERQEQTEQAGRILDSTNEECVAAGFYRTLQPRRYGGYEFDLPTFAKVMIEVSRGCPSTGWVVAFTAGHTHVLAKYPQQAQDEVYGAGGEFRGPFVGGLTATATPVEGGYVLDGHWDYASGCDVSTHFFGSCAIPKPDGTQGTLVALFPRHEYAIEHNWDMLGLKGTGSHRVVVKDLFVPSHRAVERNLLGPSTDETARALFDNPMYQGPSQCILMAEIAAVAIGTGYAALDCYEDILTQRNAPRSAAKKRVEEREFQLYFGQAMATLDVARDALIGCTTDYMEYCRLQADGKQAFLPEFAARIVLVEQQCCRLAGEAVNIMVRTSGSSAARPGHPLQRYHRDMTTLLTHHSLLYDRNQEAAARMHFGLEAMTAEPGSAEAGTRGSTAP